MSDVIYADDALIGVAKAAGEPVIPLGAGPRDACLHRRLEAQRGERLWVVHRIDREASGVVVFARNPHAHRALSLAFEHRMVEKTYLAFAAGALAPPAGCFDAPLHAARKGRTRPAEAEEAGSREAVTDYLVRRRWRLGDRVVSLVELAPHQGRHHQLRVHLRSAGAPILFDPIYGRAIPREVMAGAPCARLALHALRLVLPQFGPPELQARAEVRPGERLVIEAPIAADLTALGEWLDAVWRVEPVTS